ncbi:hypothetical protein GCK72_008109 [Caenorhabditis remanei]|uniref:F-box associated domain-containing protein n=1 Tax=Caenorhabditis remanei TaxID=31234 RepID=A0A6A5HPB6_CAERE|nr:hypothetical protein GCK72_008109 [Caenorhabditis remanei]KAF1768147.1 hypothetical protein GCK72_008109 [Caenorhabditis remanei]
MSSLTLRCILQYIEANKRIHVSFRCPTIKQVEKSIPLCLDNLVFWGNTLKINSVMYSIMTYMKPVEKDQNSKLDEIVGLQKYIAIDFEQNNSGKHSRKNRIREDLEAFEATTRMIRVLLGGRNNINVDSLGFPFNGIDVSHLPMELKFKANKIDFGSTHLNNYLPFIAVTSFPLKELMIQYESSEYFQNPAVQTAQKLLITDFDFLFFTWIDELKNLPNKNVVLNLSVSPSITDISGIIQTWKSSGKDIKMCYTVKNYEDREWTVEVVDTIREEFNGNFVELSMPDVRYNECISLPMSKTSEIVIFGFTIFDPDYTYPIRAINMQVIPVGLTAPID